MELTDLVNSSRSANSWTHRTPNSLPRMLHKERQTLRLLSSMDYSCQVCNWTMPKNEISTSLRTVYEHDFQVAVAIYWQDLKVMFVNSLSWQDLIWKLVTIRTLKLCWRMLACCWSAHFHSSYSTVDVCCISNTNWLRCHSLSRSVSQCTPAMPVLCRLQSAQVSIFEACAETKGKIHLPTFLKLLHGDGSTGPTGSTGSTGSSGSTMFATVVNVCNSLLVLGILSESWSSLFITSCSTFRLPSRIV